MIKWGSVSPIQLTGKGNSLTEEVSLPQNSTWKGRRKMMLGDTIVAVSTPRGKGGVALLRVSGPDAISLCNHIFLPKSGKQLLEVPDRTAVYGSILSLETDGSAEAIDDGIATVFRAPASFTGEDTVELCCHGGILLTEMVYTSVLAAGARAADAGEFTRRAFLNGKISLSSAESLGNLLEAQTREQVHLAHHGMDGRVDEKCRAVYDSLCAVLSSIYAKIDYPDEDLAEMSREEIDEQLAVVFGVLEQLANTYSTGHAIAEGIATVICGKPNVGKSSLYNCILGRDAAIVTDVKGTTRDILTETASFGKVTLRLYDTAGLRDTADPVEQIGIERARLALKDAELVLAVFDGSISPDREDLELIEQLKGLSCATVIAVLNKEDIGTGSTEVYTSQFEHTVSVSAKHGEGISALSELVERLFLSEKIDIRRDAVLGNARQHGQALSALSHLRHAREAIAAGLPLDLCCADVEGAMEAIAQLDGRAISEDIVSQIFSHFCVGK